LIETKSFAIPKQAIWDAYKRVRSNKGAGGVDGQTIADIEQDVGNTLYKIWNRMCSGSYFPKPVLAVDIPKASGGTRRLGIPTVSDRIAQMVVKQVLEPELESIFDDSTYGYRPNRSAHQALQAARRNCRRCDWVVDVDIEQFFDSLDHDLLMKAIRHHTDSCWIQLYIKRWLTTLIQLPDGTIEQRDRGTPQGGVISPLLANLYLHYAFDRWVRTNYPSIVFERYADDIVCHCRSERQAKRFLRDLRERLARCGLRLHKDKTRVVYCKDDRRTEIHEHHSFTFLGYDFRPRLARNRQGVGYVGFGPGVGRGALKAMGQTMRRWQVQRRTAQTVTDLLTDYGPILRGWIQYYGLYNRQLLNGLLFRWQRRLIRWVLNKYKSLRHRVRHGLSWWRRQTRDNPELGQLWQPLYLSKD